MIQAINNFQSKYEEDLSMNKSSENTIKLFDVEENLTKFLETSQAKFWQNAQVMNSQTFLRKS